MPLTPLFFRLNAVNAAIFPIERHEHRYSSGWTPLTPIILRLNAVNANFSGWTPLTPMFFRLNAVNAVTFPVERR